KIQSHRGVAGRGQAAKAVVDRLQRSKLKYDHMYVVIRIRPIPYSSSEAFKKSKAIFFKRCERSSIPITKSFPRERSYSS
ncbi:MAG: hypothetical protein KAS17_01570, partial [Victivallaceae bacterium]|nr:hypothetical protein [Victivallaceae bacterium]